MVSVGWPHLQPDWHSAFVTEGSGGYATNDYAVTAFASDSSRSLTYIPSERTVKVTLSLLREERFQLAWFNPRTGDEISLGTYATTDSPTLTTPDEQDWLLLGRAQRQDR
ncbi:MAG: putative collagen-binding domain-containing protein [Tunicatimonas sp.]